MEDWELLVDSDLNERNEIDYIILEGKGLNDLFAAIGQWRKRIGITRIYVNDLKALYIYNRNCGCYHWTNDSRPIANSPEAIDFLSLVDNENGVEFRYWKKLNPDAETVEEIYRNFWEAYQFFGSAPSASISSDVFNKRVLWRNDGMCANAKRSMSRVVEACIPQTEEELDFYINYDRGGLCYINPFMAEKELHIVGSADKKSCHLGSMVSRKYPISGFQPCDVKWFEEVEKDSENTAFIAHMFIKGLRKRNDSVLPDLQFHYGRELVIDNEISDIWEIRINEVDWEWFKENFEWKEARIKDLLVCKKDYLPKDFIKFAIKLFSEKDKEEKETFRRYLAKQQTELIYGNSIKRLYYDYSAQIDENGEVVVDKSSVKIHDDDKDEDIVVKVDDLTFKMKQQLLGKRPMPLQLGIWTVAYSRLDIWKAIKMIGEDKIAYGDTDSSKGFFTKEFCDVLNEEINENFRKAENYYGLKLPKELGRWVYEYTATRFRIGGRKWYLYETEKEGIKVKAAGANIKVLEEYCRNNENIWNEFSSRMEVEGIHSKVSYNFKKNMITTEEKSYMPFTMSVENEIYY